MTSFSSGDAVAVDESSVGGVSERLKHLASASLGDYKNITWPMSKLKYGHVHVLSVSRDVSLNFS